MKTMFVYAVLALGWASSAWPQGFSSYVPRYIAQPLRANLRRGVQDAADLRRDVQDAAASPTP